MKALLHGAGEQMVGALKALLHGAGEQMVGALNRLCSIVQARKRMSNGEGGEEAAGARSCVRQRRTRSSWG